MFQQIMVILGHHKTPQRYPYLDVVVGLVWSHDPKSYAGSRASHVVVGLVWSHDPKSYAGGSVCYW
jgi:hypothetical protein